MNGVLATELLQRSLSMVLSVAGPLLLAALAVGIIVSLLQAVTQIQEQSLTFIPKLLVVSVVFIFALPWMIRTLVEFTVAILRGLPSVAQ